MFKYQCKECGIEKELRNATLVVVDGQVKTKEAKCKCGKYMQEIKKDFTGFPTIIRNEPKR
jgi:hypothetical protein|tara:strand:+ start:715 stop:897 length:183 start_codon:yes stop_codon:yes gene_type:complete